MNPQHLIAPSKRQKTVLQYIRKFLIVNEFPPTRKQIAEGMKLAQGSVIEPIHALVRKGWLEGGYRTSRNLRLTQTGNAKIFDATAPLGIDKTLKCDDRIIGRVDAYIMDGFKPRPDFFVQIDDPDAAIDLAANDLIAVEAATSAEAGRVVIGQLGERIVCRRVQASQPNGEALQVEGVVLGTLGPRGIER